MEMIRVAGFAIAAAFAAAAVRQMRPEAGMAIALAATVVNRKEMPATKTIATNVCTRFPCITSK